MIIDSHLHLWVNDPVRYPWSPIGGYIPKTEAPLAHYLEVMDANGVDGAVFVQPTPYGWDNSYLLECKQSAPAKFKAVVLVDPLSDQAAESLERLVVDGADGLRINLHLQPLEKWQDSAFSQLWVRCVALDLPVCLQLTPEHLPFVGQLAAEYPTRIILDHLARPKVGSVPEDDAFHALLHLAEQPNICVKLSGMNYYSAQSAPYRDTWQLLQAVKESFGAERCLWGSDFPFVEEHWSYRENLDIIRNELGFSDQDLDWVLGRTAKSIWWNA